VYRERGRRWAYAVVERVYESCGVVWRMKDDGRPRSIGMGMARAIGRVGRGGCACHALHAHLLVRASAWSSWGLDGRCMDALRGACFGRRLKQRLAVPTDSFRHQQGQMEERGPTSRCTERTRSDRSSSSRTKGNATAVAGGRKRGGKRGSRGPPGPTTLLIEN